MPTLAEEIKTWETFFIENGIVGDQKVLLVKYLERLYKNKVPVIFEYQHLAMLMGFNSPELAKITLNTKASYRSFKIPKKTGGFRIIQSPYPALAHAQQWIYHNILKTVDFGDCSYAFCQGRNIVQNAKVHLGSKEFLKVDIHDFFGSINIQRVISVFKEFGYTNLLSFHLASICCFENSLPQGACTSPALSNIIAKRLDKRLESLAKSLNLKYSRYADDITISGSFIPNNIPSYVEKIIHDEGFILNKKKTVFKKTGGRKIVTGLLVTEDKIRVQKKYRREFRKEIHFLFKNLENQFNGKNGKFDPIYIDRLIGKSNYILSVEPFNQFAINSLKKLKEFKK